VFIAGEGKVDVSFWSLLSSKAKGWFGFCDLAQFTSSGRLTWLPFILHL
jgi:hypothetical protein